MNVGSVRTSIKKKGKISEEIYWVTFNKNCGPYLFVKCLQI